LRNSTIENLVLSWGALALFCLAAPFGVGLTEMVVAPLERNVVGSGEIRAREAAAALVEPLLLEDRLTMQDRLLRLARTCPDFLYVFVVSGAPSPGRRIAAYGRCPTTSGQLMLSGLGRIARFRSSAGLVLDIRADILGGQLGQLHLGLSRAALQAAENRAATTLSIGLAMAFLCLVTGVQIVTRKVSLPLRRLGEMMSLYPGAPVPRPGTEVSGSPEVDSLATQLQGMIDRLETLEAERTATQQRMLHTERLAALGELAAGLVHELRNPVDGMLECVSFVAEAPDRPERVAKYLPLVGEGLERVSSTLNGMLGFIRSSEDLSIRACQVREVLRELEPLIQARQEHRRIDISIQTCAQCSCLCSVDALLQVCLNLVLNAFDALDGVPGPRIRIDARCDNAWVYLCVADNGPGVPEDLRSKVFAPFFTTKVQGRGTGLGLSVSRELVRAGGGELLLVSDSGPLPGACFQVKLVRSDRAVPADGRL